MLNRKEYAQAIIVGSYITYLLSLTDKEQQIKGSSIRLRDKLLKVTRAAKDKELVELANKTWQRVLDKHKEDNLCISPAIVIETLYFSFIDIMNELYGREVGALVCRYVEKQSIGNINDYTKDSYLTSDSLRDELRKVIYEWSKDERNNVHGSLSE